MKKFLVSLLLLATVAVTSAQQLTITNSVKVALTTNDDAALRLAWKLDNNDRTNGFAPYTVATNALTFGQWQDWKATDAFRALASTEAAKTEARMLGWYRIATDADKAKAMKTMMGLGN